MAYAGVIIKKGDKILLQFRDNRPETKNPLTWGIFGGKIEQKETPKEAAIRELNEELGLNEKKLKQFIKTKFRGEQIYIFEMNLLKNLSKIKLNEGKKMKLFSKEKILKLKNAAPGIKKLIRFFYKK